MDLEQLRKKFQKAIGLINYSLSEEELKDIIDEAQIRSLEQLDLYQLRKIVTGITGVKSFLIIEALDVSDLAHLFKQMDAVLSKLDK